MTNSTTIDIIESNGKTLGLQHFGNMAITVWIRADTDWWVLLGTVYDGAHNPIAGPRITKRLEEAYHADH